MTSTVPSIIHSYVAFLFGEPIKDTSLLLEARWRKVFQHNNDMSVHYPVALGSAWISTSPVRTAKVESLLHAPPQMFN
eukprot:7070679-Pyramimonas_sp.AAC.1